MCFRVQNTSKCTILKEKIQTFFWRKGIAPTQTYPTPTGEGICPPQTSPPSVPLFKCLWHSNIPPQTTILAMGLSHCRDGLPGHCILYQLLTWEGQLPMSYSTQVDWSWTQRQAFLWSMVHIWQEALVICQRLTDKSGNDNKADFLHLFIRRLKLFEVAINWIC